MPGPTELVSLDQVHEFLQIEASLTDYDFLLQTIIDGCTPIIEHIVGPVLETEVTEFYDGGSVTIELRRGPVISVTSVTEYIGAAAYVLTQVADPGAGTAYSYMVDLTTATLTRRTAGGGVTAFYGYEQSVKVDYTYGHATVPNNVVLGTLELVRHLYQQTQLGGRPQYSPEIQEAYSIPAGFAVPNRVLEILMPNKRAPNIA